MNADTELYTKYLKKRKSEIDWMFPAENFIRIFKINFKNNKKLRCLDFGCGDGRHTEFLIQNGCKVLATDISTAAINLTKLRLPKFNNFYKYKSLEDFKSNISKNKKKFDLIVCWETIHFLGDLNKIINLISIFKKILKKKGKIIITFPAEDHYLLKNKKIGLSSYLIKEEERKGMKITAPNLKKLKIIYKQLKLDIKSIYKYSHGRVLFNKTILSMKNSSLKKLFSMYAFLLSK